MNYSLGKTFVSHSGTKSIFREREKQPFIRLYSSCFSPSTDDLYIYPQVHYIHDGSSSSSTDSIVFEIELSETQATEPLPVSLRRRQRFVFNVRIGRRSAAAAGGGGSNAAVGGGPKAKLRRNLLRLAKGTERRMEADIMEVETTASAQEVWFKVIFKGKANLFQDAKARSP